MKKLYIILCSLAASLGSYSQGIEWTRQFSFSDWIHLSDIVTYKDHIYAAGVYEGCFGAGHPNGSFLYKLDMKGQVVWEKRDTALSYTWLAANSSGVYFLESDRASGRSVLKKLDDRDQVVSQLEASGKMDVDEQGNAFFLSGNRVSKYSPAGNLLWNYTVGDNILVKDLKTGPSGDLVIAGAISNPYSNAYVAKISSSGKRLWALRGERGSHYGNSCSAVSVGSNGDIYVAGYYSEAIGLGGFSLNGGMKNTFTLKISSEGECQWAEAEPQESDYDVSMAVDIVNDSNGNVFVARNAGYILKYDTDGMLEERSNIASPGYEGAAVLKKLCMHGNMLLTIGTVLREARIGNTDITTGFLNDLFIAGIRQEEDILTAAPANTAPVLGLYPNPSSGLFTIQELPWQGRGATIRVTDPQGKLVRQLSFTELPPEVSIDMTNESKGMYFMEFITKGERLNRKLLVE